MMVWARSHNRVRPPGATARLLPAKSAWLAIATDTRSPALEVLIFWSRASSPKRSRSRASSRSMRGRAEATAALAAGALTDGAGAALAGGVFTNCGGFASAWLSSARVCASSRLELASRARSSSASRRSGT